MGSIWFPILFILGIIGAGTSTPYYTVVGPKIVRPNSEYHVAISISAIEEPATINVELSAVLDAGGVFNVSKTSTIEPNTTRVITLEIGDTSPGKYKLIAKGVSGIEFSNSTDVQFDQKSYSILVQTDRAIYKPGNNIQFRAIVLDPKLRPVKDGTLLFIYVTDGKANRVKQWEKPTVVKGVFTGELQLSEFPVLGDWKICVQLASQKVEKTFEVAEYVLPKFEVVVDVPKDATFKDSSITAIVRAKYTYGKPVKGKATISASTGWFSGFMQPGRAPIQKTVPLDGKAVVSFDIVSELGLEEEYDRHVQLEVTVEEELTGIKQNTSAEFTVRKYKYTMEFINTASSYKPGLKYSAMIKVAHYDGSPVLDKTNPVQIWYGYTYDRANHTNITRMLDNNGLIHLDFYPPADTNNTQEFFSIEAEYLNLHQYFSGPRKAYSPSGTYILSILKTENPTVGGEVEIEVNSTVPLKYLSYEVLGRGDVLDAASIQVAGTSTATFRFLATPAMAPTAHLIVYYLRDDGEIIPDALDIPLSGTLQNFVDVEISPEEAKPGADVDLVVLSKPNSYIGLLGVDESSILLKSGNDISLGQVMDEVKSYESVSSSPFSGWGRPFGGYWGASNAYEVFDKSGAVVLTNGFMREIRPNVYPLAASFGGVAYASFASADRFESVPVSSPIPGPPGAAPPTPDPPKVRKNFPETWLWEAFDAQPDGRSVLQRSVPDAITSWVLTAFSIDPVHGFGLIEKPRKLKVFQPFFLSLNLPYSVIRGEIVAIQVVVFNYLDQEVTADVILENTERQFSFAELSNDVQDALNQDLSRKERITVKAQSGSTVSFMIVPKELGDIIIKTTATTPLAGDSVEQTLLVKAEGETQYKNKAIFVDLRDTRSLITDFTIDLPEVYVPGSEYIEVAAVGDILGTSLSNIENLIKMPYGCGEQNMLNFVPNIVVIEYLKNINQLTPSVHGKALKFLEVGYQRELTYRHDDGSFSAFGKSDDSGSTWLTAFVAKSFIQASDHINIEGKIIKEALHWLVTKQAPNGSFPEVGRVSHQDMQGGAAKGLALTAFTLIAFLQDEDYAKEYKNTTDKGVEYIVSNLPGLEDAYSLAICTYVLNLAKHPQEQAAFSLLQSKAEQSDGYKWWGKPVPQGDKNPWHSLPSSVNVEMTSYVLLTYLRQDMVADSLPILRWLISQRNAEGGFASTQDTVIGIYAMSKLGEKIATGESDIGISFTYGNGSQSALNITSENNLILQKHILPKETRKVNVTARGSGFGVIQVAYRYNLNVTGDFPLFTLKPNVDKESDANKLQLTICSAFIPTNGTKESNMAVMEVNFPSGFTVDQDTIPILKNTEHVKRVETKNGDTTLVLYFDKMVEEEYCVTVFAFRTHKVAKQKPVPVTVYDYYDLSRKARVFYEPLAATLCDICEGEDCAKVCKVAGEDGVLEEEVTEASQPEAKQTA